MSCGGLFLLLETFLVWLTLHLELFMSILSHMLYSFLILLSCHPFVLSFADLSTLFGLSAPLIVSFLSVKACSPLSRIFPFLCTIWTITCSSLINHSWFLLILDWRVGVHWRCKLKFFLAYLCHPMAWRRVILLSLLAIRQPSWRSKNELHWYLHESFIFNDLEMSFVWPWSLLDLRDTIDS